MLRRSLLVAVVAFALAQTLVAAPHSAAVFKRLQSLAGDWEGKDEHGMPVKTIFKVVISDTALMETISPSGMEEMMTVYSVDRDGISLVHYCPTNMMMPITSPKPGPGAATVRTRRWSSTWPARNSHGSTNYCGLGLIWIDTRNKRHSE